MKNFALLIAIGYVLTLCSCSPQFSKELGTIVNEADSVLVANSGSASQITQGDAASAIKEALGNGIKKGVAQVSVNNGYLTNAAIKVILPKEADNVEAVLRDLGQSALVDKAVAQMNHAAEQAAPKATNIFIDAITKMTISDAIGLVQNNQPDACTQFLKKTTTDALVAAFKPSIKTALDQTYATAAWGDVMSVYNKVPFVQPVNTDLPDYVTHKAIDGLFYTIAQEEAKIRKDPMAQVSDLIKRVFGTLLKK